MKYNQLFYNIQGVFRYLKLSKMIQQQVARTSPALDKLLEQSIHRRAANSKWRKLGLIRDDLIIDEHDVVQEALQRLPKPVLHARYARFKVALHTNMMRRELPEESWPKVEDDKSYLMPFIEQVLSEHEEREKYDKGVFARQ